MAPLHKDQLKDIRDERKQQIMRAAIKVFAENGIQLTKISMIAKEAGISHGLVYHYFDSKEELLYESLHFTMRMGETLQHLKELDESPISPLEKIKTFTKFALTSGSGDVFRVIQHLTKFEQVPAETQELIDEAGQMYVKFFYPIFMQGQLSGEIIEGDIEQLLELYFNVLTGILVADEVEWWKVNLDEKIDLLLRMIAI